MQSKNDSKWNQKQEQNIVENNAKKMKILMKILINFNENLRTVQQNKLPFRAYQESKHDFLS